MLFVIKNTRRTSTEQLRTNTLLTAYFIIQKYTLATSDILMDNFIQQQYGMSLKNMCIKLLLNLTFHKNDSGDLMLVFNNKTYDTIASMITYGNGIIPGSKILKIALKN
jgi:hypothetical protein